MKLATDLEQSKLLAKILPVESADMYWFRDDFETPKIYPLKMMHNSASVTCPCWSLTALINVVPSGENVDFELTRGGYRFEEDKPLYVDEWFASYENEAKDVWITCSSDDAIDAMVDLIVKLKEKNIL